jgi:lysophospholipase L1-like esterase
LVAVPLLIFTDTAIARLRGWTAESEGMFGRLPILAFTFAAMAALPAMLPFYRRLLRAKAAHLWLASASILSGVLIAELALNWLMPGAHFHCRPARARYAFDPDYASLPGVSGQARSTMNSLGLRGPELPEDGYRILCLGGGTTECLYLDDSECWTKLLADELSRKLHRPVCSCAAAVSDYGSGHHERFLRRSALPDRFDCVVVLVGANDLVRMILGLDSGEHSPPWWLQLRTIELLKELWNVRLEKGLIVDYDGREFIRKRRQRDIGPPPGGVREQQALDAYADRIRRLARAARQRGLRLVLVTQPTLWDDFLNPLAEQRLAFARTFPEPRKWEYLRPGNLREQMDRFNLRLKAVAKETGTELVDLASLMSGEASSFYDDFHFSEKGARQFARLLAEQLARTPATQR